MSWILAIKIESLGSPAASPSGGDKRRRYATRRPAWDTETLYTQALLAYPQEIEWRVNLQRAQAEVGGQEFALRRSTLTEGGLMRGRVDRLGVLAADIDEADTSLQITAQGDSLSGAVTTLAGTTILLGREAIHLSSHSGAGVYACTRGVLGTRPLPHTGGIYGGAQAYNAAHGRALRGRAVDLVRVDAEAGDYDEEEVLWSGVLTDVGWDGADGAIRLRADTLLRLLSRSKLLQELPRFRRVRVNPGDTVSPPAYAYQAIRANTPCLSATPSNGGDILLSLGGDAVVRVGVGFTGSASAYRAETDTLLPGRYTPFAGSPEPPDDLPEEAWEIVSTHPSSPSNYGGGTAALPLSSNPLTLALQILTTSPDGTNYDSGGGATSYDLGIRQLGLNVPWDRVDVAGIEAVRSLLSAVAVQEANHLGVDGEPVDAEELIQQRLLRPYGLTLTQLREGKIGVVRVGDALPLGALHLTQAVALGQPSWRRYATDVYAAVEVRYNDRPGIGPRIDSVRNAFAEDEYVDGAAASEVLRLDGLAVEDEDAGVPAEVIAAGLELVTRYSEEIPGVSISTRRTFDAWHGDVVRLSHAVLPDLDGSRGCDVVAQVDRMALSLGDGEATRTLGLLLTGVLYRRAAAWSVAARVVSWSSPWVTVEAAAFTATTNPTYSTDLEAWEALFDAAGLSGATLELRDSALTLRNTAVLAEIDVAGNRLRLSSAPTTPAAGDVLILASYNLAEGSADEALFAFVAYLASDDAVVGSDEDDAYEWTS